MYIFFTLIVLLQEMMYEMVVGILASADYFAIFIVLVLIMTTVV